MKTIKELEVLILLLVDKHPRIKDLYSLTRFFAKSSVLPDELYETLLNMVTSDQLTIVNPGHQVKSYQITSFGQSVLKSLNAFDFIETFALTIDESGFIAQMAFLLNNKECLIEIIDSFKLSNDMIIAFIEFADGKLPDSAILENPQHKKWQIKRYLQTTNSIEGYEKIKQQEMKNIFQYELEGIHHTDKPAIGDLLIITKGIR